jgi:hypothetical protein
MNVRELKAKCKDLNIKGYSRMNKAQLQSVIYLKQISNWYDELYQQGFVTINGLECDYTDTEQKIINNDFNLSTYINETNQC